MENLPRAEAFLSKTLDTQKRLLKIKKEKQRLHNEKMREATEELAKKVITVISLEIKAHFKSPTSTWFDIKKPFDCNEKIGNVPVHVLWYGHLDRHARCPSWNRRTPLKEVEETAFQKVQKKFAEYGYLVYEVSDLAKGVGIYLRVCSDKSHSDEYLNVSDRLWHDHNMCVL